MGVMKGKDKKNKVRGFYLKVSNEVRGEKEEVDSRYKKEKKMTGKETGGERTL